MKESHAVTRIARVFAYPGYSLKQMMFPLIISLTPGHPLALLAGDIEGARGVLERAAGLRLGAAKMRAVFKKFLALEKSHGDAAGVERVKRMAVDFVESKRNEMVAETGADEDE